jgi:uncharacterized protein
MEPLRTARIASTSAAIFAETVRARSGEPIDLRPVAALFEQILARWNPKQIWLFGSRARGHVRPLSDWDFLIVVPDDVDETALEPLVAWRLKKASGVRADLVLCRAGDFAEDCATPNTITYEAASAGVLVYER